MSDQQEPRRRAAQGDPLQVNLRWLVYLILFTVVVPTTLLTGVGVAVLFAQRPSRIQLALGLLEAAFVVSVLAGAFLLIFLARRGTRLARVQETFLSHISHELITPLAGIRLHSQILAGTPLPADVRRSVDAIGKETDRLRELVERILRWRQIRSPNQLYRRVRVSVQDVVDRVVRTVSAPERLVVQVRDPSALILADPEALSEAIANLVQNAFKYGGPAPVELTARRFGRRVIFAVSDRGEGLPPGPRERLFDPFYRWSSADRPDPGGVGLGLAIAQQIAREHGGRLEAVNRPRQGSRFYILLPVLDRR